MLKAALLMLGLLGCGRPPVHVFGTVRLVRVDPQAVAAVDSLIAGLAELGRADLVSYGAAPGISISVSTARISEFNRENAQCATGAYFGDLYEVLLAEPGVAAFCASADMPTTTTSDAVFRLNLAHEIGHALTGSEHRDHGLMQAHGDFTCIGREAACLIEAVNE